ncbi:uncharacterized protein [Physcomitrium patens]|uniref:C2 domain-containing protein n=1 Tax=Physcomitrium patens TaxID=3218 RepID=A0A2K1JCA4_PHYPA|nr:uncharacterized protein LOC112292609 isoform X1 [Physcomitrium patens]PNR39160.1 hypothetical protein PHYPA_019438 [Physcomitrium patens]|eukprot:XP_024397033.1 uncharacterized protein LOC112292609 isoform X1 [Physcomitrella patens]
MPGTIRVSVLEAVDLPEGLTDGTIDNNITAKVTLGPKLFKTPPLKIADGGKIEPWNSDFAFPVMNLRDKLGISICDSEDRSVSQTAIEIPSIIQKGSRDEFVELGAGGRIHLKMSFVLSDEERKKIETMRVAALKRKEEERMNKTIVFQTVPQPAVENVIRTPPVSRVTITEVDESATEEREDSKGAAPASTVTITEIDDSTTDEWDVLKGAAPASTVIITEVDESYTDGIKETQNGVLGNGSTTGVRKDLNKTANAPLGFGTTKPLAPKPMFDYAKAIGMQKSRSFKRTNSIKRRENPGGSDFSTNEVVANKGDMHVEGQRWGGYQATRPRYMLNHPEFQSQSVQGPKSEVRSGPGARWAQKNSLEAKWTSPEEARRIVREERVGQVTDHFKVRAKILELIKVAAGSHDDRYGDDRSFQDHHGLADSIGAVLHKVVGGAAMLLAALLMTCPARS